MASDAERPSDMNEQSWDLTAAALQAAQAAESAPYVAGDTATPDSRGKVVGLYALSTEEIADALTRRPTTPSEYGRQLDAVADRQFHDYAVAQTPIVPPELAARFPGYPIPNEKPMLENKEISIPPIIRKPIDTKLHEIRNIDDYQNKHMEISPKIYDY